MTRAQEVAMIEAAVKAGQVKKLPYQGEAISLVAYVRQPGTGKNAGADHAGR